LLYSDGTNIHRLSDATAAAGVGNFSGALLELPADLTLTAGVLTTLDWQAGSYDTDSFYNAANPSRLTVPSGVSFVILRAQVRWDSASSNMRQALIFKNGVATYHGYAYDIRITDDADLCHLTTPVLPVSSGDYFEVLTQVDTSSGNKIKQSGSSWFSIQVVG